LVHRPAVLIHLFQAKLGNAGQMSSPFSEWFDRFIMIDIRNAKNNQIIDIRKSARL